jgi:hypothetical protein
MNTKARKTRTKVYTDTLVTRIAPQVKEKFEAICLAEYNTPSYVVRDLIMEYVRNRTAVLNSVALHGQQQKPKQRPAHEWDLREPTSPRPPSQQSYDTDWD